LKNNWLQFLLTFCMAWVAIYFKPPIGWQIFLGTIILSFLFTTANFKEE